MATRPVFLAVLPGDGTAPGVKEIDVAFTWHAGLAPVQKRKNVDALHQAFRQRFPNRTVLEASRAGESEIGRRLSAFNLRGSDGICVEAHFQAGKVFDDGRGGAIGPFTDRMRALSVKELRDEVKAVGATHRLVRFFYKGEDWPLDPQRFFYDWLYCSSLAAPRNASIRSALASFDAFTDISFNPQKSINCQAHALALFRSLQAFGRLEAALASREAFQRFYPEANPPRQTPAPKRKTARKRGGRTPVVAGPDVDTGSLFEAFGLGDVMTTAPDEA